MQWYLDCLVLPLLGCPARIHISFVLPFLSCNRHSQAIVKLSSACVGQCWGFCCPGCDLVACSLISCLTEFLQIYNPDQYIFQWWVPCVLQWGNYFETWALWDYALLQSTGISSCTWEMAYVLCLVSYPLNNNENSLSWCSSGSWLHRSRGNSHMNWKVTVKYWACCIILRHRFYHVPWDQKCDKNQWEALGFTARGASALWSVELLAVKCSEWLCVWNSAGEYNLSSMATKACCSGWLRWHKLALRPLEQQHENSSPFLLVPKGYSLQNWKYIRVLSLWSIALYIAHTTSLHAAPFHFSFKKT